MIYTHTKQNVCTPLVSSCYLVPALTHILLDYVHSVVFSPSLLIIFSPSGHHDRVNPFQKPQCFLNIPNLQETVTLYPIQFRVKQICFLNSTTQTDTTTLLCRNLINTAALPSCPYSLISTKLILTRPQRNGKHIHATHTLLLCC